jgi:hypothetical membrane protein
MKARPNGADSLGRGAALVSVLATLYFLCAVVAAHLVSPQYELLRDYLGDYASGRYGWIYGSAFWASFIATLALAVAFLRLAPSAALSRVGLALMVVVALTFPIEYFFPTDILLPGAGPTTTAGTIHLVVALIEWTLFPLGALLLTLPLRRDPDWARGYGWLLGLALLSILLLAALWVVIALKAPFGGLADKLFFFSRNLWALSAGLLALRASEPQPPH